MMGDVVTFYKDVEGFFVFKVSMYQNGINMLAFELEDLVHLGWMG